jgi:hypothetical protein
VSEHDQSRAVLDYEVLRIFFGREERRSEEVGIQVETSNNFQIIALKSGNSEGRISCLVEIFMLKGKVKRFL